MSNTPLAKPEAGKYYITRSGRIVGPLQGNPASGYTSVHFKSVLWGESGRTVLIRDRSESPSLDLIAEVAVKPVPVLKVKPEGGTYLTRSGNRVRLAPGTVWPSGTITHAFERPDGVIRRYAADGIPENGDRFAEQLVAEAPSFSEGDYVVSSGRLCRYLDGAALPVASGASPGDCSLSAGARLATSGEIGETLLSVATARARQAAADFLRGHPRARSVTVDVAIDFHDEGLPK